MMFGRKKRPSQLEEDQPRTSIAHLGATGEDDDIIELVDIIEIPEDHEAESDLLGLTDTTFDDEYPGDMPASGMDPSEIAAILEDDQAELLEDTSASEAEAFLAEDEGQVGGRVRELGETEFNLDDLESMEFEASEDLEDEKLIVQDDTDRLIAELMSSHRDEEGEDVGALVEEYVEDEPGFLLPRGEDVALKEWEVEQGLTDLSTSVAEPEIADSDKELDQLFDGSFNQESISVAAENETAPAEHVTALVPVEQMLEQEVPTAAPDQDQDVGLTEADFEAPFAPVFGFETAEPSVSSAVHEEPVLTGNIYTVTASSVSPVRESLFSITATSPMLSDSMTLEEEIVFAYRPGEERAEGQGRVEPPGAGAEVSSTLGEERAMTEDLGGEPAFDSDTFLTVAEAQQPCNTEGMELLDLVGHMETRLMECFQETMDLHHHEMVRNVIKEELDSLRHLIDQIDAVEELRL